VPLSWEWLLGLALVLLGSVLLALGRWRREASGGGWIGVDRLPGAQSGSAAAMPDYRTEPLKHSGSARSTARRYQGPSGLRRPRC
jgi:hypothetical protein